MSKHFNYEDDHDWDDDVDYEAMGYVYWYGKYYPKENIDALYKNSNSEETGEQCEVSIGKVLVVLGAAAALAYGIMKTIPYFRNKSSQSKENKSDLKKGLVAKKQKRANDIVEKTEDIYIEIYHEMAERMNLDTQDIEFVFDNNRGPVSSLYSHDENKNAFRKNLVYMTRDSLLSCYKGSLAHELEHLVTGNQLIEKIGLENFIKLQRNENKESSLAFKTLSEYLSWKKAMEENEDERSNIRLKACLSDYHSNYKVNVDEFYLCDVIAAHAARISFDKEDINVVEIDRSFSKDENDSVRKIMQLLIEKEHLWPLSMDEQEILGKQLMTLINNL